MSSGSLPNQQQPSKAYFNDTYKEESFVKNKEERLTKFFDELETIQEVKDFEKNKNIDVSVIKMFKLNFTMLKLMAKQNEEINMLRTLLHHDHSNGKIVIPINTDNKEFSLDFTYIYDDFLMQLNEIIPLEV